MRPDIIKSGILSYSENSNTFLNHLSKENEVFAVIDNSGWLSAINNPRITPEAATADGDVYF